MDTGMEEFTEILKLEKHSLRHLLVSKRGDTYWSVFLLPAFDPKGRSGCLMSGISRLSSDFTYYFLVFLPSPIAPTVLSIFYSFS